MELLPLLWTQFFVTFGTIEWFFTFVSSISWVSFSRTLDPDIYQIRYLSRHSNQIRASTVTKNWKFVRVCTICTSPYPYKNRPSYRKIVLNRTFVDALKKIHSHCDTSKCEGHAGNNSNNNSNNSQKQGKKGLKTTALSILQLVFLIGKSKVDDTEQATVRALL